MVTEQGKAGAARQALSPGEGEKEGEIVRSMIDFPCNLRKFQQDFRKSSNQRPTDWKVRVSQGAILPQYS